MKISYITLNRLLNIFLLLLFITAFLGVDESITKFTSSIQSVLILIYLASLSLIIYELASKFYQKNQTKNSLKDIDQKRIKNLSTLSIDEKYVLSKFFDNETTEYAFDAKNVSVQTLVQKELLVRTSRMKDNKTIFLIDLKAYQLLRLSPKYIY